jgi:hypothetical protein
MDMLTGEHGLCTETCSTSSADENQFLFVNVDEVTDIKEEDDQELTSPVLRAEPVVSLYVSTVKHIGQRARNAFVSLSYFT